MRKTSYCVEGVTGRPQAALAVVRVSGPRAGAALEALIGRVPEAWRRQAYRQRL